MQITSIQYIYKSNLQHKRPSITNSINFKGQDSFERTSNDDVTASKKYYRGDIEIDPSLLMQQGLTLFIKGKNSYMPCNATLLEFNSKGEAIKQSTYCNGFKNMVSTYKNGQIIQRDEYKDIYGSVKNIAKRTTVVKFDHNAKENKTKQTFGISRNYGNNWKNCPTIIMRKNDKKNSLFVSFISPSDEKRGEIEVSYNNEDKTSHFYSLIYDEKDYFLKLSSLQSDNETALLGLEELRETIQNEEFRDDFGFSTKFNSELDKAIEYLNSKLNCAN